MVLYLEDGQIFEAGYLKILILCFEIHYMRRGIIEHEQQYLELLNAVRLSDYNLDFSFESLSLTPKCSSV